MLILLGWILELHEVRIWRVDRGEMGSQHRYTDIDHVITEVMESVSSDGVEIFVWTLIWIGRWFDLMDFVWKSGFGFQGANSYQYPISIFLLFSPVTKAVKDRPTTFLTSPGT